LAQRIAKETGAEPLLTQPPPVAGPDWDEAAPGISLKLLATNHETNRVSMLVRLAPGTDYPPHCHAGAEELYLLEGELMVDDRTLHPGDYIHATAGTIDHRVWSKTGCTCVLITSTKDAIL
jgi:anti-sigma factor ChrR (cupin superfamily)